MLQEKSYTFTKCDERFDELVKSALVLDDYDKLVDLFSQIHPLDITHRDVYRFLYEYMCENEIVNIEGNAKIIRLLVSMLNGDYLSAGLFILSVFKNKQELFRAMCVKYRKWPRAQYDWSREPLRFDMFVKTPGDCPKCHHTSGLISLGCDDSHALCVECYKETYMETFRESGLPRKCPFCKKEIEEHSAKKLFFENFKEITLQDFLLT